MGYSRRAIVLGGAFLVGLGAPILFVTQVFPHWMRAPAREYVVDVPTRPGAAVRALVVRPDIPSGSVILLAGGHGNLDLGRDGRIGWGARNQVVRTRHEYAARGLVAIVPDVATDFKAGSGTAAEYRWSESHARDLAVLTAYAAELAKPVYVVGTSRAALSVAALASRAELQPQPDAVVITSGMLMDTGGAQPSVQRNVANLERMRGPMLLVFHKDDRCPFTPPASAEAFRALARGARTFDIKLLSGGAAAQSDPCEALSAHGFIGLDREVVDTVVTWLERQPRT